MSAAAPLPPPGPSRVPAMNGFPNGAHNAGSDGWAGSDATGEPRGPGGSYPAIAEISASASEKVNSLRNNPIKTLLDLSKYHFGQAGFRLSQRQPAPAYWDYLVAYFLVAEIIPGHHDYYDKIEQSRSQMHREFRDIMREVKSSEERFMRIKDIIMLDNQRNGATPSSTPSSASSYARPSSQQSNRSSVSLRRDDELMLPEVPTTAPISRAPPANPQSLPRKKPPPPPPQPKPHSLQSRALHQSMPPMPPTNGTDVNNLVDRLAKLRGTAAPIETASNRSSQELSVKMPSPTDYQTQRPMGPRDMPPHPSHAPPAPPKLPLNTQFAASLPKEPSPTYSPARNLSLPASINPPRSTARSIVGTGGRSNSIASSSSVSNYAPNGTADSYFPLQPSVQEPVRRASISRPAELQITAEKLYDYIRMFDVLLIDVRDRMDYDSGHVFVRSIMCIEPSTLQDGCSAEQLQERLVISPDDEQAMYDRRHEYDVVVYYDQCTKTNAFLQKHMRNDNELALKRLYDTLYEFNADKPLKRPPVFLMGGIDAWAELVGSPALKMSTTSALVGSGQARTRPIRRSPVPGPVARLNMSTRRRREYAQLDVEEERKLLEEARKGRKIIEQAPPEDEEGDEDAPYFRTTEEFLRRYPDIDAEQSMMYPPSRPQPASQYEAPPMPMAPSRPPPSVPRVSYSGVHERQVAPQGRGAQPPVYVSPGRFGHIRLHRTGLLNFGVTCYMNSVVQCLSGHRGLSDLFLTGRWAQQLQKDNWKGTKGILPEAYATLISNLYKGDISAVRPSTFRRICGRYNSAWGIDEQQDAKEFLEFVLDYMHEDLNVNWNKPPLKPLTDAEELTRERFPRQYASKIEWGRYQHRDRSQIGEMFAGQHASQLTCQTCGVTSTTYEAFYSISVEIPREGACDLRDCLRSYCSAERLDESDSWRCPRCKKDREAMKKITITRAPDTLVVHFKRFSASHNESARKVRTPVHFPLQGLDMSPFIEPSITPEQEAYVLQNARDGAAQLAGLKTDPAMNGPYIYNAYAVIWHIGATLGSGHYIAFVKDKSRGCWRSFNDEKLTDFEPGNLPQQNRLQNEKAYIVFYERERVAGGVF